MLFQEEVYFRCSEQTSTPDWLNKLIFYATYLIYKPVLLQSLHIHFSFLCVASEVSTVVPPFSVF